MTGDLVKFVEARLGERERAAKAMQQVYPTPWDIPDRGWMARVVADGPNFLDVIRIEQEQAPGVGWLADVIEHVWLHAPDNVLADIEARRKVLAECAAAEEDCNAAPGTIQLADAVRAALALPFADHPDYREEWKP